MMNEERGMMNRGMGIPRLLLAAANWISLLILIWLLILGLVPLGTIQVLSLVFFFIIAVLATVYKEVKS